MKQLAMRLFCKKKPKKPEKVKKLLYYDIKELWTKRIEKVSLRVDKAYVEKTFGKRILEPYYANSTVVFDSWQELLEQAGNIYHHVPLSNDNGQCESIVVFHERLSVVIVVWMKPFYKSAAYLRKNLKDANIQEVYAWDRLFYELRREHAARVIQRAMHAWLWKPETKDGKGGINVRLLEKTLRDI